MEETGDAVDLDTSSENSQQQWLSLTAVTPLPLDKTPTKGILLQSSRYVLSSFMILVQQQDTFKYLNVNRNILLNLKLTSPTLLDLMGPITIKLRKENIVYKITHLKTMENQTTKERKEVMWYFKGQKYVNKSSKNGKSNKETK